MKSAYPQFADVIDEVAKVVQLHRKSDMKTSELEIRLGRICNGKYTSGVSRQLMDSAISLIETNTEMVSTDWCEFHDYFYNLPTGQKVRTRVSFNTDDLCIESSTVCKTKITDVTLSTTSHTANTPDECDALRISLSNEEPVRNECIPTLVNTTFMRLQQRRSFTHNGFSFDFSLTWQAANKTAAEKKQQEEDPLFAFEIEITDPDYIKKHDDEWVAASLLLKALDFIPGGERQLRLCFVQT
jgi:hypothetical protein